MHDILHVYSTDSNFDSLDKNDRQVLYKSTKFQLSHAVSSFAKL